MRRRKVKHLKLKLIGNELTDGQYNTVHSLDGGMKKGERENYCQDLIKPQLRQFLNGVYFIALSL
jgi:hypothetical protein